MKGNTGTYAVGHVVAGTGKHKGRDQHFHVVFDVVADQGPDRRPRIVRLQITTDPQDQDAAISAEVLRTISFSKILKREADRLADGDLRGRLLAEDEVVLATVEEIRGRSPEKDWKEAVAVWAKDPEGTETMGESIGRSLRYRDPPPPNRKGRKHAARISPEELVVVIDWYGSLPVGPGRTQRFVEVSGLTRKQVNDRLRKAEIAGFATKASTSPNGDRAMTRKGTRFLSKLMSDGSSKRELRREWIKPVGKG